MRCWRPRHHLTVTTQARGLHEHHKQPESGTEPQARHITPVGANKHAKVRRILFLVDTKILLERIRMKKASKTKSRKIKS